MWTLKKRTGGEGEVGAALAGAFAFPDTGGGAGEYVHGCVTLGWVLRCQYFATVI